jgi:TATA-box binding protein (TBP) (component of TFIID and TFIIIB)
VDVIYKELYFRFLDLLFKHFRKKNSIEIFPDLTPINKTSLWKQISTEIDLLEELLESKQSSSSVGINGNRRLEIHVNVLIVIGEKSFDKIFNFIDIFSNMVNMVSKRPVCFRLMGEKTLLVIGNVVWQIRLPVLCWNDSDLLTLNIKNSKKEFGLTQITSRYEPNTFPSLRVYILNLDGVKTDNITLQIFQSGFVVITGVKTTCSVYRIYPALMRLLFIIIPEKLKLIQDLEASHDLCMEQEAFKQYDDLDRLEKLGEEWKKEKIQFCNSKLGNQDKKQNLHKKVLSFRKSDLKKPKKKFRGRYLDNYTVKMDNVLNLKGDARFSYSRDMELMNIVNFDNTLNPDKINEFFKLFH